MSSLVRNKVLWDIIMVQRAFCKSIQRWVFLEESLRRGKQIHTQNKDLF